MSLSLSATDSTRAVQLALQAQVDAWNAGELERAMSFYWNSPRVLWVSKAGIDRGYGPVLEGFQQDFADRSTMGTFSYEPLHIEALAADTVYYVYRWQIEHAGQRLMGTVSSQVWRRLDDQWHIVAEHAS